MSTAYPMRYAAMLLGVFVIMFVGLGISPASRGQWLAANVPVFVILAGLVLSVHWFRFTRGAYTCLFALLLLHEISAHYADWLVPGEQLMERTTGFTVEQ